LAVCAFFAIAHQARRFARLHGDSSKSLTGLPTTAAEQGVPVQDIGEAGEPPGPMATVAILRQVGPFGVGQVLAEGWTIDSFDLSEDGFSITLMGAAGRARFDITCSSRGNSPFDVGDAHILYSRHVDFADLEAVGKAVQEQFRKATEGHDVCERVLFWRTAAQANRPG
jgi:hypothetical protein